MIISGKISKRLIESAKNYAGILFTPQMGKHIVLNIKTKKKIDELGYIEVDGYNQKGLPREFIIAIQSNLTEEEQLITLAHEMVHAKQYAYGELNEEMTTWHGAKYDPDNMNYDDMPWEIEAESVALELYWKFNA